jgi:hypothetical protein
MTYELIHIVEKKFDSATGERVADYEAFRIDCGSPYSSAAHISLWVPKTDRENITKRILAILNEVSE